MHDNKAMPTDSTKTARAKLPKQLAMIRADHCTGCGACVEVCPVGCISKIEHLDGSPRAHVWCEIDWDRCIGCKQCIRIAGKKSDPYVLTVCPWEAIEMVPIEDLTEAVARLGGHPEVADSSRERMLALAKRQCHV